MENLMNILLGEDISEHELTTALDEPAWFEEHTILSPKTAWIAAMTSKKADDILQWLREKLGTPSLLHSCFDVASEFRMTPKEMCKVLTKMHVMEPCGNNYVPAPSCTLRQYFLLDEDSSQYLITDIGKQFIIDVLEDAGYARPEVIYLETGIYPLGERAIYRGE